MGALLVIIALVGAWELYADFGPVESFLLPPPHQVGQALVDDRSLLWSNFTVTAQEVALGMLLATVAGIALAVLIHLSPTVRRAVYPLLIGSQSIPLPIYAPLLVAWLGYDIAPKLAIVALICFFPIVVTVRDGLAAVDPELLKLMRTLDASRWRTLRVVEAPSALPALFSGLRIAVTVAMIGAVFAELSGSSDGLGHLIQQSIPQFETARAYAAVAVLSVFAVALVAVLTVAERRLLPWAHASRGAAS
ncbi:MAG TPA: ABC transporter permease [Solirubrobacteraceae bacterium]|jgi:NitT/TauT family transport system permease protein/putative hydroxymethylpyrimidine transport system permease protein|nr:ABC transporter permease [Solirubrobacteraceae bacterium]